MTGNHRRPYRRAVVPVAVGLVLALGWVLADSHGRAPWSRSLRAAWEVLPFSAEVSDAQPAAVPSPPAGTPTRPPAAASPTPAPGIPAESYPDYPAAGIDAGVWNDGKAALWDLSVIDQYTLFGPRQRAEGHRPEQPVNFSHIVHVQQNKMECQYCHWNVTKSDYAAIPDVESCMGCHKFVKGRDDASKAEIKKVEEYWNAGKPIPWVKVHVMPDHYKFNHKRHVKAGMTCHSCHGQVPEMPVVERVSAMKMGWCIDCHRQKGSSIDCMTCHH